MTRPTAGEVSRHEHGVVRGVSRLSDEPVTMGSGCYDVSILTSSWDQRSIVIAKARELKADLALVIEFEEAADRRKDHDSRLEEFANGIAERQEVLRGSSTDTGSFWKTLLAAVGREYQRKGRPLQVHLDLSTCPRYYTLGLLATGIRFGSIKRFVFTYTEGRYPQEHDPGDVIFRRGHWKTLPVPALEGSYDPGRGTFYFVALGFEGGRTLRVISRADPDRVAALIPRPGVLPEYYDRTMENNRLILEEFVGPSLRLEAPAGDAIDAWAKLGSTDWEDPTKDNLYYLCSGTKPHALALALHSLSGQGAAVLYSVPEEHVAVEVEPLPRHWTYEIESTSVPL